LEFVGGLSDPSVNRLRKKNQRGEAFLPGRVGLTIEERKKEKKFGGRPSERKKLEGTGFKVAQQPWGET